MVLGHGRLTERKWNINDVVSTPSFPAIADYGSRVTGVGESGKRKGRGVCGGADAFVSDCF